MNDRYENAVEFEINSRIVAEDNRAGRCTAIFTPGGIETRVSPREEFRPEEYGKDFQPVYHEQSPDL